MIRNAVIIGLGATLLAACQPMPPPHGPTPPSSPEPQAEATTNPEPPEGKPLAPVDVRKLTCATLSGSSDDDKAYATSFLMGYRSALIHSRTIEIKRIEAVEQAALADCSGKPDAFASKIFAAALARIGPGGELREPHHEHRRGPPTLAAPGAAMPDQQPPTPDQSTPAIQYSPTPSAPSPMTPTPMAPTPPPTPPQVAPAPVAPAQVTPPPPPSSTPPPRELPPPPAPPPIQSAPPAEPAQPPAMPIKPPSAPEQKQ
jgi:hypothetical protein